jgi:hypothetical protein
MGKLAAMDASVLAAIAKWPNVPEVFGWLRLTARGQWLLRGEPIGNAAIRDFIGRNYAADAHGRWFFQNGPQRVYVALELTPWVYRLDADGGVATHTGAAPRELRAVALLDDGRIVAVTELGAGVVDDRDSTALLRAVVAPDRTPLDSDAAERWLSGATEASIDAARLGLDGGIVPVQRIGAALLGERFGFEREPAP